MKYVEAIAYLNSFINFESLPDTRFNTTGADIHRFRLLLERLGTPQSEYPIVHIAGTKGKGSTAAILESILVENGYKVGLYTSPHLITVRERVRINRKLISQASFAKLISHIAMTIFDLKQYQTDSFRTVFEHLTVAGLLYFAREKVDIAIVETGLGGRLDATIIVDPVLSIITPIGLDHTAILGETVTEIAKEKMYIIKQNIPSVSAEQLPSVKKIVQQHAANVNSELQFARHKDMFFNVKLGSDQIEFDLESEVAGDSNIVLNLGGSFQLDNLSTALYATSSLKAQGFTIGSQSTIAALQDVKWEGRFQQVGSEPVIILDGAHNQFAIQTILKSLEQNYPRKRWRIVFSTLKNKPWEGMLTQLSALSTDIYITPIQFPKSLDTISLKMMIKKIAPSSAFFRNAAIAFEAACNDASPEEGILVIGSLYLVGEIMRIYAGLPPPHADGSIDDRI